MSDVLYTLVRQRERGTDAWIYWLLRLEGNETEVIVTGKGLSMRLHIVTYLREVAELDGPDGPAATRALKNGWATSEAPLP